MGTLERTHTHTRVTRHAVTSPHKPQKPHMSDSNGTNFGSHSHHHPSWHASDYLWDDVRLVARGKAEVGGSIPGGRSPGYSDDGSAAEAYAAGGGVDGVPPNGEGGGKSHGTAAALGSRFNSSLTRKGKGSNASGSFLQQCPEDSAFSSGGSGDVGGSHPGGSGGGGDSSGGEGSRLGLSPEPSAPLATTGGEAPRLGPPRQGLSPEPPAAAPLVRISTYLGHIKTNLACRIEVGGCVQVESSCDP
jgi:hypothetical protein